MKDWIIDLAYAVGISACVFVMIYAAIDLGSSGCS